MAGKKEVTITVNVTGSYTKELKARLEKYGFSQGQLARESGIAPTQLSRMFRTEMTPHMANIVKIERALLELRKKGITWEEETRMKNEERWAKNKDK